MFLKFVLKSSLTSLTYSSPTMLCTLWLSFKAALKSFFNLAHSRSLVLLKLLFIIALNNLCTKEKTFRKVIWVSGRYLFIRILSAKQEDRQKLKTPMCLQLKMRTEDYKELGI